VAARSGSRLGRTPVWAWLRLAGCGAPGGMVLRGSAKWFSSGAHIYPGVATSGWVYARRDMVVRVRCDGPAPEYTHGWVWLHLAGCVPSRDMTCAGRQMWSGEADGGRGGGCGAAGHVGGRRGGAQEVTPGHCRDGEPRGDRGGRGRGFHGPCAVRDYSSPREGGSLNFEIISRLRVITFVRYGADAELAANSLRGVIISKQHDAPSRSARGANAVRGMVQAVGAPTRRPPRRLTARRSSSLIPPHTPAS
jgi:hypothetical protein